MKLLLNLAIILVFIQYASSTVLEQRAPKENGYECGNTFFTDIMIQNALSLASSDFGKDYTQAYVGPMYSTILGYKVWPILPDGSMFGSKKYPMSILWRKATYQIIYENEKKVIDVIVRTANGDFTRCWRKDTSLPEASIYDVTGSNGYRCGHKFIYDKNLKISIAKARENIGLNKLYPTPYTENPNSEYSGLMLWPIYQGAVLYYNFKSN